MEEKNKNKISLVSFVLCLCAIVVCILAIVIVGLNTNWFKNMWNGNNTAQDAVENISKAAEKATNKYANIEKITQGLSNFDLKFLKVEDNKENMIYSPLSMKYALKMLQEGAKGDTKDQINALIGDYDLTVYNSNENMALANAFFIKDSFKVKDSYINTLKSKYGAEVKLDSFANANNVNSWIEKNTLKLISNMLRDDDVKDKDYILVNALGIDMEWKNKFLNTFGSDEGDSYAHEDFDYYTGIGDLSNQKFDDTQDVSGMKIEATFNNYDIIKEIGEEKIREIVTKDFTKYLTDYPDGIISYSEYLNVSDSTINKVVNAYVDKYIKEIKENYGKNSNTTDFSIYVDDNVKVFAKDLKKYNGTTLQYIGIMPTKENLADYVKNIDEAKLNKIIDELKDLKNSNFKQGVVTRISGFIPKFKFEYDLDLKNDLKKIGITDVFDKSKADLSEIANGAYVEDAKHKANIEFTQDGIKASAATVIGGLGAGGDYDYIFEVPVEKIDLTFDKPFMFIIRDKDTGETWFTGEVYNPLKWSEDTTKAKEWSVLDN